MQTTIIITWAVVMAVTLLLEFFTVDFFACCFSFGALISLILAACGVNIYWQVSLFFIVTVIAILATRPLVRYFIKRPTVPTNIDQNFGKKVRLMSDVVDGHATIKINDVVWKVNCDVPLKQDDEVVIECVEGNKMIVKPVEKDVTGKQVEKK